MPTSVCQYWFGKGLRLTLYNKEDYEFHTEGRVYAEDADDDFWIFRGLIQRNYLKADTIPDYHLRDLLSLFYPHFNTNVLCPLFNLHDDSSDKQLRILCEIAFTLARRVVARNPEASAKIIDALFDCKLLEGRDIHTMCTLA